ncbi:unnamed protein product, partial [Iphiclides podalirius]
MRRSKFDEPNMSDSALLVKVEDLIYMAMGPDELRMLEQQVEIRFKDVPKFQREASGFASVKREIKAAEKGGEEKYTKQKDRKEERADKKDDLHSRKDKASLSEPDLLESEMFDEGVPSGTQQGQSKRGKESAKAVKRQHSPKKGKKQLGKEKKAQHEKSLASESSITIDVVDRDKSKVLVVDKGPASSGRPRVGSVEVVTQSQFELLENEVKRLAGTAGLSADLTLPDNEQLKDDLLKGNVTLTEAMQAMQVNARVQAAEQAIGRMAGLLTQLAAAGAMPEELAQELRKAKLELPHGEESERMLPKGMDQFSIYESTPRSRSSSVNRSASVQGRGQPAIEHDPTALVTRPYLDDTLQALKMDLTRNIQQLTNKASHAAEAASHTTNFVSEKIQVALQLDGRMNEMQSLVSDYAVQLNGLDVGLTTQMQGFREQMTQIRTDLKCGLEQLASVNDNAEATALKELQDRYGELILQLEMVNNTHQATSSVLGKLTDELRSLVDSVEMLRDQKMDRDEVLDALRDKADISRLAGLLTEEKFAEARAELDKMFEDCHQKFRKQDKAWMCAMEDLKNMTETKVGQLELASERDRLQEQLRQLHGHLQRVETQLGDPKAALLMRHLSRGAVCGSCGAPAMMEPGVEPLPPPLPASLPARPLHPPTPTRPAPLPPTVEPAPQPCKTTIAQETADDDALALRRWCGGAHTLQPAGRQRAPRTVAPAPRTRRYDGVGTDGKLYLLEEDMLPCAECNLPQTTCDGSGDAALQEQSELATTNFSTI